MKNNNIPIDLNLPNLLNNREFLSLLKFESDYASLVKGGHLPYYYSREKKVRLVSSINILSSVEQKEIVHALFISKN